MGMSSGIFRRLVEVVESGGGAVLVMVVAAEGAPREAGAKMLVFPDGRVEGTVGGGALEHHAIEIALDLLRRGEKTFLESRELGDLGMLCGGRTTLFYEVVQAPPTLAIFGAGHVGRRLMELARLALPWRIVLFDHRPELLANLPPDVEGQNLPCPSEIPALPSPSYAVVATDSHDTDFLVVSALLAQDPGPAYLGLLGSSAKAKAIRARLLNAGIPQEKVDRMRCPAGLPLGGKDPGSVAVSILAELVAFHHGRLAEIAGPKQ